MINWNDLKDFDLAKIDLAKIDLPTFDLSELPEFDLPADADRAVGLARDAAYAAVGIIVLGVQKADERRRELADQLTAHVRKLVDTAA